MISLLLKKFASPDIYSGGVLRRRYGIICGCAGIFFNLLLFAFKLFAGSISGSVAIIADSFNNLSDAATAAVTLCGFMLAGRKADSEHPFGHGRIEYICATAVSLAILLVGFELLKASVMKILHPEATVFNRYVLIILVLSIAVKLYMAFYNKKCGEKINAPSLVAVSRDSFSDCIATGAVLLCAVFMHFTKINADGFVGMVVSLLIMWTGIKSVHETISPLLGSAPDPAFVKEIEEIVNSSPETLGIHDLVVHDYGPEKLFVSLHMEVDGSKDLFVLHDAVDLTEREIAEKMHCEAIIHMDPIDTKNPVRNELFEKLKTIAREIDETVTVHDFRMVPGPTHTNLIFDVVLSPKLFPEGEKIAAQIDAEIKKIDESYFTVITVESSYV